MHYNAEKNKRVEEREIDREKITKRQHKNCRKNRKGNNLLPYRNQVL